MGEVLDDNARGAVRPMTPEDITVDDKRKFVEYVVSGDEYSENFSFIGGFIKASIRLRSPQEDGWLRELMTEYIKESKPSDPEYLNELASVAAGLQVTELVVGEEKTSFSAVEDLTELRNRAEVWRDGNKAQLELIFAAITGLDTKYTIMLSKCHDSDWWDLGDNGSEGGEDVER